MTASAVGNDSNDGLLKHNSYCSVLPPESKLCVEILLITALSPLPRLSQRGKTFTLQCSIFPFSYAGRFFISQSRPRIDGVLRVIQGFRSVVCNTEARQRFDVNEPSEMGMGRVGD